MAVTPKFSIGEHVVFKGTTGRKKRVLDYLKRPKDDEVFSVPAQVFRVTDHLVETCYGGTQIHYGLRPLALGSDGLAFDHCGAVTAEREIWKAREIELEAAPEAAR